MNAENRCPQCDAELAANAPARAVPGLSAQRRTGYADRRPGRQSLGGRFRAAHAGRVGAPFPRPGDPGTGGPRRDGRGLQGPAKAARPPGGAENPRRRRSGQDPAFAERFAREARAMAMLSHPHIVAVYDFGQTELIGTAEVVMGEGGLYYFLMEFVDGLNLRQLLDTGKLAPEEALAIVPQICEALQYRPRPRRRPPRHQAGEHPARQRGPGQDRRFRHRQADGPRRAEDLTLTGAGQVVGTPHYMAPEQIEHPQAVDHRADIYSLGVVFYQMLTGELPHRPLRPALEKSADRRAAG